MRGILFKPDMIQAIVAGRKTVTRRLSGLEEINKEPAKWVFDTKYSWFRKYDDDGLGARTLVIKPRYHPGEVVYAKEAWRYFGGKEYEYQQEQQAVIYKNDVLVNLDIHKWHSPLFMPTWAARIFIKIIDVRPERLNQISSSDVTKEGFDNLVTFMLEWDKINGKRGYEWKMNCWVWVYEFQKA